MSQLTVYLDPETASKMKKAAESEGVSRSKWVAKLIEEKLSSDWSKDVKRLSGAWADFPEAEELRRQMGDSPRDPL